MKTHTRSISITRGPKQRWQLFRPVDLSFCEWTRPQRLQWQRRGGERDVTVHYPHTAPRARPTKFHTYGEPSVRCWRVLDAAPPPCPPPPAPPPPPPAPADSVLQWFTRESPNRLQDDAVLRTVLFSRVSVFAATARAGLDNRPPGMTRPTSGWRCVTLLTQPRSSDHQKLCVCVCWRQWQGPALTVGVKHADEARGPSSPSRSVTKQGVWFPLLCPVLWTTQRWWPRYWMAANER